MIAQNLSFRPLAQADFPLLQRWLAAPHVNMWWRESLDLAGISAKFGPRVDGTEPTYVFVIEYSGKSIGWIQWYRWDDYSEHARQLGVNIGTAGIDLAIAELDMVGVGLGPLAILKFLEQFIFIDRNISSVVADPEVSNYRSLRAFQKAGFTPLKKVQLHGVLTTMKNRG